MRSFLLPLLLAAVLALASSKSSNTTKLTPAQKRAKKNAIKNGCVIGMYPLNPDEPWPTTADPNHKYTMRVFITNRNKSKNRAATYKSVYVALQAPAGATILGNSFRTKPAAPGAAFIPQGFPLPPLPGGLIYFYGPIDIPGKTKQIVDFSYTLGVCNPPIFWNMTTSLVPNPQTLFQRVPPLLPLPETCKGYFYNVSVSITARKVGRQHTTHRISLFSLLRHIPIPSTATIRVQGRRGLCLDGTD